MIISHPSLDDPKPLQMHMPNNIVTITRYHGTHRDRLHSFLQKFVQNIAAGSSRYSRLSLQGPGYLDYGLLTNERGSYSLMAAAMDRITPMHQSEMSVSRRVDYRNPANRGHPRERAGRVDLWSCYDGFEYFLEFKRALLSPGQIHGCIVPKNIKDSWGKLVNQIAGVKRGVARNPDPDYVRSSCSNLRTGPRPDPGGVHGVLQLFRPVLGHRHALPAT